ncbi:hypothetical protein [Mucilaginibacter sp.]|jgi:hypothetical protein|uniref:hypothetical protein n=1 Tax=Mucilaginibacter sp. TaxID=1882438 RepID=UPI003569BAC4
MKTALSNPVTEIITSIRPAKGISIQNNISNTYKASAANREKLDAQTDLLELMCLSHRGTFVLSSQRKNIMKALIQNLIKARVILYCFEASQIFCVLFS